MTAGSIVWHGEEVILVRLAASWGFMYRNLVCINGVSVDSFGCGFAVKPLSVDLVLLVRFLVTAFPFHCYRVLGACCSW